MEHKIELENRRSGIHRKESMVRDEQDPFTLFMSKIINTREARGFVASILPEILNLWAGSSFFKKILSKSIGKNVQKTMARPGDILMEPELPKVFREPFWLVNFADHANTVPDLVADMVKNAGEGIDALGPEEKEKVLSQLLESLFNGRSSGVITTWAGLINRVQEKSPDFLSKALKPGIARWIENTDFGELKFMVKNTSEGIGAMAGMVNDEIWKYPAKVVILVSFLPDLINLVLGTANECLGRFNNLAPDLVADVVISCLRDVDGKGAAALVNEISELFRKIDTGSSLIGDSGVSGFSRELSETINTMVSSVDFGKLLRAREAVAAGKNTISEAVARSLEKNPEIILDSIRSSQVIYNPAINSMGRKINLVCDLPEDETAEAFSEAITQVDFNEVSEIVNLTALLMNRIRGLKPRLLPSVVSQVVDGLDLDEIQESVEGLLEDVGEIIEPLGRTFAPHLIKTLCHWLMPGENHCSEAADEARKAISDLLSSREVN